MIPIRWVRFAKSSSSTNRDDRRNHRNMFIKANIYIYIPDFIQKTRHKKWTRSHRRRSTSQYVLISPFFPSVYYIRYKNEIIVAKKGLNSVVVYFFVFACCYLKLAVMEKTKMVILNNGVAEEPVPCSGHLCRVQGLTARTVILDDVMANPESPDNNRCTRKQSTWKAFL